MKYIIQIYIKSSTDSPVGRWDNTNWGGNNIKVVQARADKIASKPNKLNFTKVRVLQVLSETLVEC
jgi:hypothetical protein